MKYIFLLLITIVICQRKIDYPIRFSYINKIDSWWPVSDIAAGMGVPGYAQNNLYNYFCLTIWTYSKGPLDIAKLWSDPVTYLSQQSDFGRSNTEIRKNILKRYKNGQKNLLISAFAESEYPTTAGIDPILCATKLALFINEVGVDGVDINYEDTKAFEDGKAEIWLISFTKKLRELLPSHIICHTPQASYFHDRFKYGGYETVHQYVGHLIDFYNIQYYNQMTEQFDTYDKLFVRSLENVHQSIRGTSILELNKLGIPLKKIVVGKPVITQNVKNTGWVDANVLGKMLMKGYKQHKWFAGVMFWEYFSDREGTVIQNATGQLIQTYLYDQLLNILSEVPQQEESTTIFNLKYLPGITQEFSQLEFLKSSSNQISLNANKEIQELFQPRKIKYPIRFTIIDRLASWWPAQSIAASLGVPGFANDTLYNYFSLSTWTSGKGPQNLAKVWENPLKYFSNSSIFGKTNQTIRDNLKAYYNSNNVSLLISAFGSSQNPISDQIQPVNCAQNLAFFVKSYKLDGVQVNFKDTQSLNKGIGQFWIIKFHTKLRQLLPDHLIVHTISATYFNQSAYRMGGYSMVHRVVGDSIDFYNVLYFDQGIDFTFDTFNQLFMLSGPPRKFGISVRQLLYRKIPSHKIVIGKPALEIDSINTGWINGEQFGKIIIEGYKKMRWFAGVMYWQYFSDLNGIAIKGAIDQLLLLCAANEDCKN